MHTEQRYHIYTSDNLSILRTLADNSVDAVVTDPPAGIGFMGKEWDKDKGGRDKWIDWMAEVAAECLRVIKPGGHALVWALPRTSHWTATAWENAGWEPRDRICHIFGSGFPKSANIFKQIDRMAGDAAKQWDGWGTALKPAVEDYWLFRKPIEKGLNIAQNVLKWGTGGLNIDGCRIEGDVNNAQPYKYTGNNGNSLGRASARLRTSGSGARSSLGRFPAHLVHDGSEEVESVFPLQPSGKPDKSMVSASRFFYCAKPGKSERDAGLEELEAKQKVFNGQSNHSAGLAPGSVEDKFTTAPAKNVHPTVKALKLMTYLCRLITPPDGLILDPFTGSGSIGCAAMIEGFRFIGMEREAEYAEIARLRVEYWRDVVNQDETIIDDVQEKLFAEMV